jgi:uncharacterized membrane protein YeaQ/YmgE (transglycosylase-associated protein family)
MGTKARFYTCVCTENFTLANTAIRGEHSRHAGTLGLPDLKLEEMIMLEGSSWLGWIIVGGIAGAIAKFIMPGKDPGGIIVTILLGIGGALMMGFLGKILGLQGDGAGFIAAIVGAVILLGVYRIINKNKGGSPPAA